jgi:hypothetical protein
MPGMWLSWLASLSRSWLASLSRSWGIIPLLAVLLVPTALILGAIYGHRPAEQAGSTAQWGGLLAFAFLCGLIGFAAVEIVKRLAPVRGWLQQRYVLQWWHARAESLMVPADRSWAELMAAMGLEIEPKESLRTEPMAATRGKSEPGGSEPRESLRTDDPVFGLPIQLLAAQISGAVDVALTEPERYPQLYYLLTRSRSEARQLESAIVRLRDAGDLPDAIADYMRGENPPPALIDVLRTDQDPKRRDAKEVIDPSGEIIDVLALPSSPEDARYFRASQRARSALDSLQISVGGRWRRSMQAASMLVATIAAGVIMLSRDTHNRWLFIISAALIGGPLAWTIRDATAVLERWRR